MKNVMLQRIQSCLTTCLIGLVIGTTSQAFPVIFAFRGNVTEVTGGFAGFLRGVAPGVPFTGFYVFESTTPNSAPPGGEGEFGLYEHMRPPAGVFVAVGRHTFFSRPRRPDFSIIANNDAGFAGTDEYGFVSERNVALPRVPGDRLDIHWYAQTFNNQLFSDNSLPLDPPDLNVLGGGIFTIYGECTPCASPNAFFNIQGTMTHLTEVGPTSVAWSGFFQQLSSESSGARLTASGMHVATVPEPTLAGLLAILAGLLRFPLKTSGCRQ